MCRLDLRGVLWERSSSVRNARRPRDGLVGPRAFPQNPLQRLWNDPRRSFFSTLLGGHAERGTALSDARLHPTPSFVVVTECSRCAAPVFTQHLVHACHAES